MPATNLFLFPFLRAFDVIFIFKIITVVVSVDVITSLWLLWNFDGKFPNKSFLKNVYIYSEYYYSGCYG